MLFAPDCAHGEGRGRRPRSYTASLSFGQHAPQSHAAEVSVVLTLDLRGHKFLPWKLFFQMFGAQRFFLAYRNLSPTNKKRTTRIGWLRPGPPGRTPIPERWLRSSEKRFCCDPRR